MPTTTANDQSIAAKMQGGTEDADDLATGEDGNSEGNDASASNAKTEEGGGESAKRKSEEVTATPERGPRGGLNTARKLLGRSGGPDIKKKKGGIAGLFKQMSARKEEHDRLAAEKAEAKSVAGGKRRRRLPNSKLPHLLFSLRGR